MNRKVCLRVTVCFITTVLLMSFIAPVLALDYAPGVSKGQFVKYGNFIGTGPGLEAYNDNDWTKYEVVGVNGSQVTLLLTGQFKNGTTILGNGDYWVYDVGLLTVNGTVGPYMPVIAGGLDMNNFIGSHTVGTVNETENRAYLGVNRTVNILKYRQVTDNNSVEEFTYVYDQKSGILLETNAVTVESQPAANRQFSYSVIETNIFDPTASISIEYLYIIAGVTVALVVVLALVVNRKIRKGKPKKYRK